MLTFFLSIILIRRNPLFSLLLPCLLAGWLAVCHSYFEDLIATAVAADAEANAPMEDVLTEEERAEVAELRRAVEGMSEKYEGVLDSLRADEVRALSYCDTPASPALVFISIVPWTPPIKTTYTKR